MAEYNNQSIDIDLEDMFNNLSDKDQEEFLVDMFRNLPGEEERADVVKIICGISKTILLPTSLPTPSRE